MHRTLCAMTGVLIAAALSFALCGCASTPKAPDEMTGEADTQPTPEEIAGIEIVSLRHTAAGYMLDFRYRVTNPEKAASIYDRQSEAYLIDQDSGIVLGVPRTAKVGPLRQSNFEPDPERVYWMFFSNHGGHVQPGDLVTIVIGECRFENVMVE